MASDTTSGQRPFPAQNAEGQLGRECGRGQDIHASEMPCVVRERMIFHAWRAKLAVDSAPAP
jgi:hypothetical protein